MNYYLYPSPPDSPTVMSLYTKEKPDFNDVKLFQLPRYKQWLTTRYAYLQEPEFKVGDKEIWFGKYSVNIEKIEENKAKIGYNKFSNVRKSHWIELRKLTHYPPGQPIDISRVSYVREVGYYRDNRNVGATSHQVAKSYLKWQPAPEPEKPEAIYAQENKKAWDNFGRMDKWRKAHAKWLKDKESGTVQAIVN